MPRRLVPYLVLLLLDLLFFIPLVLRPTCTLYSEHSDLLAMHVPMKRFLVSSFQETGEIPLWNPYSFAGTPFAGADVQVAAFYPLHWPLFLLDERHTGAAMSWLAALHVLIAGWTMFAYSRAKGLGELGAFVAAVGWMFAGKWMLHLLVGGHYPMIGIAWLPLVLMLLESAIRHGAWKHAMAAGGVFALIVLSTHPQLTFYCGLFIALWTLRVPCPEASLRASGLLRWLKMGLILLLTSLSLSAIQLLPTLEAIPESSRASGTGSVEGWRFFLWKLLAFIGPTPTQPGWEERGNFGIFWLASAAIAVVLGWRAARWQVIVLLLLVLFGLGGAVLLEWLPGFSLFRIPARMLMLAAFPIAYLSGVATHALFEGVATSTAARRRCRRTVVLTCLAGLVLLGLAGLPLLLNRGELPRHTSTYWALALVQAVVALWLLARKPSEAPLGGKLLWVLILLGDAWQLTWPLVAVQPDSLIYTPSPGVRWLGEHLSEQPGGPFRVLDRDVPGREGCSPLGYALPMTQRIETVRGWNGLNLRRYHEYLQLMAGESPSGRGREIVAHAPVRNPQLLNLLGVRYHYAPKPKLGHPNSFTSSGLTRSERPAFHDPQPIAFGVIGHAGGWQIFPPYRVEPNDDAMPRAFVVTHARPMPPKHQLVDFLRNANLRTMALLDGLPAETGEATSESTAQVVAYQPNRIHIRVNAARDGFLVLTDPFYPGWLATVDGTPTAIHRANHLFRVVAIPGGEHEVIFRMHPTSLNWGRAITLSSLGFVSMLLRHGRRVSVNG